MLLFARDESDEWGGSEFRISGIEGWLADAGDYGKKGLFCFWSATVVDGPWPGQRMVESGSDKISERMASREAE